MLIIIDMVKAHKCKDKQRVGYKASQENHNHASQEAFLFFFFFKKEAFLFEGNGLTNKRLKRERIFVRGGIRFLRINYGSNSISHKFADITLSIPAVHQPEFCLYMFQLTFKGRSFVGLGTPQVLKIFNLIIASVNFS